ncbi:transcription initiation factor TFIID subunit 4-like [Diceros bicornis minor]|uniref:transcription initiation factor TFIID subunit 4-like n=1 Tax=Diceros bicornis minor TaxID=77932 RepID=UPI0026EE8991|nr:transcription initiation factor TFIID subunit 4-like [Diceros bicornis minor]
MVSCSRAPTGVARVALTTRRAGEEGQEGRREGGTKSREETRASTRPARRRRDPARGAAPSPALDFALAAWWGGRGLPGGPCAPAAASACAFRAGPAGPPSPSPGVRRSFGPCVRRARPARWGRAAGPGPPSRDSGAAAAGTDVMVTLRHEEKVKFMVLLTIT